MDPTSRIMALDIGTKRTGLALTDDRRIFALPHSVIHATQKKDWIEKIAEVMDMENIGEIVVGIPLNQHGEEGQDAKKIREYIALLRERFTQPVIEWDERFTTLQAERTLLEADLSREKRKQVIDKVAASIILQSYLDSLRFQQERSAFDDSDEP